MIFRYGNSSAWLLAGGLFALFVILLCIAFLAFSNSKKRLKLAAEEAVENSSRNLASVQEQLAITKSFSRIYYSCYFISLLDHTYYDVSKFDFECIESSKQGNVEGRLALWLEKNVEEEDLKNMTAFVDLSTLPQRLGSAHILSCEYRARNVGWARCNFIVAKRAIDGQVTQVLFAIQEIDEAKKKELKLHQYLADAYAAANRASAAKTEFLASMSHDIRTPINAIIGMTAIAEAHMDDREWIENSLSKITAAGKHLLGLINEVLDMSRIEAGKMELLEENFNLLELVDNLLDISRPLAKEKNHELFVSVGDIEHENVIGDSGRIRQMFMNLMGNAIKYTPDGGRIRLSVSERSTNKAEIGCYEFVFEDNGIGMSREFLTKLFEPFSRANDANAAKIQGTGLGLAITKNIVQMMNGDIKVESTLGKGSRFTVTIYLELQDNNENPDNEDFIGLPVLVADDDETACESIGRILKELGMECETVLTGREAVERAVARHEEGREYFAIILDWKMPEMNGRATTEEIRKRVGQDTPVIIASAYDWTEIEPEARSAGAGAFISKPCYKTRMIHLFRELLDHEKKQSKPASLEPISADDYGGKRVLLVEDNEINAEIAEEIFKMANLQVEHAWNGKEALDSMTSAKPGYYAAVFMDIQMPVMNGLEAAKAIRALPESYPKNVPIIAMSANAFAEDVRAAKDAGMNEHIPKPLDFKQLSAVLKKWLADQREE